MKSREIVDDSLYAEQLARNQVNILKMANFEHGNRYSKVFEAIWLSYYHNIEFDQAEELITSYLQEGDVPNFYQSLSKAKGIHFPISEAVRLSGILKITMELGWIEEPAATAARLYALTNDWLLSPQEHEKLSLIMSTQINALRLSEAATQQTQLLQDVRAEKTWEQVQNLYTNFFIDLGNFSYDHG